MTNKKIIYPIMILLGLGIFLIPVQVISLACFIILALLIYYIFVFQRAKNKTLYCGQCKHEVKLSTLKGLTVFHKGKSYYHTCPKCGYKEAFIKREK